MSALTTLAWDSNPHHVLTAVGQSIDACRSTCTHFLMLPLLSQVLSNGDARFAAQGAYTNATSTVYHNQNGFGSTLYNDPDLATIGADGSSRNMCATCAGSQTNLPRALLCAHPWQCAWPACMNISILLAADSQPPSLAHDTCAYIHSSVLGLLACTCHPF